MTPVEDLVVVGGGIVGLATATAVVRRRPDWRVVVLEKEAEVGGHQSGHNSGVIHCGIYYRPGTAKARLCRLGAERMLAYCEDHAIRVGHPGKLIVATEANELRVLDELAGRAEANGVAGVRRIGPAEMAELEPHAAGLAALHCPTTAVVDFRDVTRALATGLDGRVRTGSAVISVVPDGPALRVLTVGGDLRARRLVNCGGLQADRIARWAGAEIPARIVPFLGEYLRLRNPASDLVRGLVYPVPLPDLPFLGVHLTRTVAGEVLAGPNALLALSREGYRRTSVHGRDAREVLGYGGSWRLARRLWRVGLEEWWRATNRGAFTAAARRLVPDLSEKDLEPHGAGVRAQAVAPDGRLVDDFVFGRSAGALHVISAPSPAATASLAIAEELAREVEALA